MSLSTDLRLGFRFLSRAPGYFALSAVTLALGIGVATLMFSITESVLWRPLPLPHPDQLIKFSQQEIKNPLGSTSASQADFLDWRASARSFTSVAAMAWSGKPHTLTGTGERVHALASSAGFFETLGVQPALGRFFDHADEASTTHTAILSNNFWRDHFGASRDAIGQTFELDRERYTIIGVLPAAFRLVDAAGIDDPELFVTLDFADASAHRANRALAVVGRLKPGVSLAAASEEMHSIARRIAAENPQTNSGWDIRLEDLRESFTQYDRTIVYLFFGFSVLVLLIASANVAGLGLVRSVGRQNEYALRMALGAGMGALRRQALAESVWLTVPGGLAGILLASWGVSAVRAIMPPGFLQRAAEISLDYGALGFVLLVSLSVAVLVALAPSFLPAARMEAALRAGSKLVSASRRTQFVLNGFIASEMALSLVLVFGAGLFLATNSRLQQEALGFDSHNLLTVDVIAGASHAATPAQESQLYSEAVRRAQNIPGVRQAALANAAPLSGGDWIRYTVASRSYPRRDDEPESLVRMVSPNYFDLLRVPLLQGRAFAALDSANAARVAIVNENFANSAFPGESPVGKIITVRSEDPAIASGPVQIVGLAANMHELGVNEVHFQDVFLPFAQNPRRSSSLLVRYAGPVAPVAAALRSELRELDPDSAVFNLGAFDEALYAHYGGVRFRMSIVSLFAVLAVVLAAVGIYGTIAFSVAQRRREFALRIALGAMPSAIRGNALARTIRLAVVAAAAGVAISLVLGQLVKSQLYLVPHQHSGVLFGVSVSDPFTLAVSAALLIAMALSASLIPASRAANVEPAAELRND